MTIWVYCALMLFCHTLQAQKLVLTFLLGPVQMISLHSNWQSIGILYMRKSWALYGLETSFWIYNWRGIMHGPTSRDTCRVIGVQGCTDAIWGGIDGGDSILHFCQICLAHDDAIGIQILLNEGWIVEWVGIYKKYFSWRAKTWVSTRREKH